MNLSKNVWMTEFKAMSSSKRADIIRKVRVYCVTQIGQPIISWKVERVEQIINLPYDENGFRNFKSGSRTEYPADTLSFLEKDVAIQEADNWLKEISY